MSRYFLVLSYCGTKFNGWQSQNGQHESRCVQEVLENSFFKNGEYEGEAVYKDPNDLVVAKGKFKNGKKVGKWQFFINGKLESEENMDKPKKPQLKKDKVKID